MFKNTLRRHIMKTEQKIANKKAKNKDITVLHEHEDAADLTESGDSDFTQEELAAIKQNLIAMRKALLKEIDNAISKIEEGTYGICDECGETISKKRLSVIPYSNLCITCKSKIEKEEKEKLNDSYSDNFNAIAILDEDTTYNHSEE